MVETTPPSSLSLAETAEATQPLPPPRVVDTTDTETQTEREDSDSPERKRKKPSAAATEVEVLRDSPEDPNNVSLEITDNEGEDIIEDSIEVSDPSCDRQDTPANEVKRMIENIEKLMSRY